MKQPQEFRLSKNQQPWFGGEPRVFVVGTEYDFSNGYNVVGANLIEVIYDGGGLHDLFRQIVIAADVTPNISFQAMLENLEELSNDSPLILIIRGVTRLLIDVGPAVLHVISGWDRFVHHGSGVSAMYLVLDTGPSEKVNAAFYPGGVVDWI